MTANIGIKIDFYWQMIQVKYVIDVHLHNIEQ